MRSAKFLLLSLTFATAVGLAQQPPPTPPNTASQPAQQTTPGQVPYDKLYGEGASLGIGDPEVCYFIRSFVFHRQDGNAPQFVRETTCTMPGNLVRKVKKHKGNLELLQMPTSREYQKP